ncbi:MAG TPA: metal ABC transporter permease [Paracoccaceae bacterium]|nr:metal ABC transporter permease [Paracoccaceae bacterium]
MDGAFLILTLPPLVAAILAALACTLPGSLLVLRGEAMTGDMMAHAALPGIAAGFMLTGSAGPLAMTAGALAAALAAVGLTAAIRRAGPVAPAAAMAISFTTLFALGVVMVEQGGLAGVHLDVEHALFGTLETLIWLDGTSAAALADPAALATLPPELLHLAGALALVAAGLAAVWRPLVLASFDPAQARALGLPVGALSAALAGLTAAATVAAFAAVGAILTVAMLVLPAATARLLTDSLPRQLALALALAVLMATAGVLSSFAVPAALGLSFAVSAGGSIALAGGLMLALAAALSPRARGHGAR